MKGLTENELKDLILSVGTHRGTRRRSPTEVAQLLEKAIDAGTTRRQCTETLGIGSTQISTFLRLLELSPDIQHLAEWSKLDSASIPFSSLSEIARLDEKDQAAAAEAILRYDMKWKEVVQLTQIALRSSAGIDESISKVLQLRPEIETRHLIIGAVTSKTVQLQLAEMSQSDRNSEFLGLLQEGLGLSKDFSARLGQTRFTIIGASNPVEDAGLSAEEFQEKVNKALEHRVAGNDLSD